MKALFIGYSKCGTKTMNVVFRTLGYTVYDAPENCILLGKEWTNILNNGATSDDFKKMYENVDACVDAPVFLFWEEILEAFPDTKLLVHYRDEDAWIKSLKKQSEKAAKDRMFQLLLVLSPTARKFLKTARLVGAHALGADRNAWPWQIMTGINYTLMRHKYRMHNLYIQKKAPKDQLHVVDFKQGWEPICKFLGEPVPDAPFPHANKAGEVLQNLMQTEPVFIKMKQHAVIGISIIIILFSIALYYLCKFFTSFIFK